MKQYKALFEVPATVLIEIPVEADDQTEGLVKAHDDILSVNVSTAKVLRLNVERAQNVAFERIESVSSVPTPQDIVEARRDGYDLHLYHGELPETGKPGDVTHFFQDFVSAREALLDKVRVTAAPYGSGRIVSKLTGTTALHARSDRGGWEVTAFTSQDETPVHSETWLPRNEAVKTALQLVARKDVARVTITDYTDRAAGPKLHRTIE